MSNGNTIYGPFPHFLGIQVTGTKWTNWTAWGHIHGLIGVFSKADFWHGSKAALTWTPSRAGFVFYNVDGTAWYTWWLDAFTEE